MDGSCETGVLIEGAKASFQRPLSSSTDKYVTGDHFYYHHANSQY